MFTVKYFDILKNEILKKQAKSTKIWCEKIKNHKRH